MSIGVGDRYNPERGGSGDLYIDDIRLYQTLAKKIVLGLADIKYLKLYNQFGAYTDYFSIGPLLLSLGDNIYEPKNAFFV